MSEQRPVVAVLTPAQWRALEQAGDERCVELAQAMARLPEQRQRLGRELRSLTTAMARLRRGWSIGDTLMRGGGDEET